MHRAHITLLLALGLVLAACAPPAAPSPTTAPAKPAAEPTRPSEPARPVAPAASPAASPSPAAAAAASGVPPAGPKPAIREKITVAVGSAPAVPYLHLDLARALGYYEDENLDVYLNYFRAGTEAATALLSGQVPFSGNAFDHAVKAKPQGKDLVAIASFTTLPGITLVVKQDLKDKIKSFQDLKGMKVGVTSIGSGTHQLLLNILAKEGMQPTDVEVVAVGSNTMPAALESGGAAAAMGADPFVSQVVAANKAFILIDLAKQADVTKYLGGDFQFTGLLSTPSATKDRADATQRLVNALFRACRFIGANTPEQIAARLPKDVTGDNLDVYTLGLRHQYDALSKDCTPTEAGMQNFIKSQVVAGVIKESEAPRAEQIVDLSFVRKAAAR